MHIISLDVETYSPENIRQTGAIKYMEPDEFEVMILAYNIDDEGVKHVDLTQRALPKRVRKALLSPKYLKTAYNAPFEIGAFQKLLGKKMDLRQWDCTMIRAGRSGYPMGLDPVAKAMGLVQTKDKRGDQLIRYFCTPCKPTKSNGMRTRNLPEHNPVAWAEFIEYCKQDVRVEMAVRDYVLKVPVIEFEKRLWRLDQKINNRGVRVDVEFVKNAIRIYEDYREDLKAEAQEITGLNNPNSPKQLMLWLAENGEEVENLKKVTVEELMLGLADGDVKRVLELRKEMSKTSVKKYSAMLKTLCHDMRCRGLFQFYGANRTGRWAGRLVQLQNLPQNHLKVDEEEGIDDLSLARSIVRDGNGPLFEMLYGDVPGTLSQLIRTAFVPEEGKRMVVADFAAIEARVIAWLAGEQWRQDVFATHGKIYEASAAQMFKVPLESIVFKDADGKTQKGPNYHLRSKGKVAELACIAEDELVLTDIGLIPIQFVTKFRKVWDGLRWVSQEGAIFKGFKKIITYEGLKATEDHLVWIEGKSKPVQFGFASASGAHIVQTGDGRREIRMGEDHQSRKKMAEKLEKSLGFNRVYRLRKNILDRFKKFENRKVERLSSMFTAKAYSEMAGPQTYGCKTTLRKSKRSRVPHLRSQRNRISVRLNIRSRVVDFGAPTKCSQIFGTRSYQKQRALRTREYKIYTAQNQSVKQTVNQGSVLEPGRMALRLHCRRTISSARTNERSNNRKSEISSIRKTEKLARDCGTTRVYDLVNCGPNNRFTVSGKLVHNCGYQGGEGALINMGALAMGLKQRELQGVIDLWREENPAIVDLWKKLQRAAFTVLRDRSREVWVNGKVKFFSKRGNLYIQLPSGRLLSYIKARIGINKKGYEGILYMGVDQKTKKWGVLETYGGKFTENIVQAIARDCLGEAMVKLDDVGYELIMHIHDEVVVELGYEEDGSKEDILNIMSEPIAWAPGLLLKAAGFETDYYKKD